MDVASIHERIAARAGDRVQESNLEAKDPWLRLDPEALLDVCRYLRDEPDLRCEALSNLSGVDYRKDGVIEVVYHLYSYTHRHMVVLKTRTPRDEAVLPSVESIWKAANWLEREVYDLLGVNFTGHTDLRRIMMTDDWLGHPLRKDFVEPEEYHGIGMQRESLLRKG